MSHSFPSSRSTSAAGDKWLDAEASQIGIDHTAPRTSISIAETSDGSEEVQVEEIAGDDQLGKTFTGRISQNSQPSIVRQVTTNGTTGTARDPRFEVDWESETDPSNPKNWSLLYKGMMLFFLSWNTLLVVLYSTSYTSAVPILARDFKTTEIIMTLGLTFYLFGLAIGSLFLAPLSEMYGRKVRLYHAH